VFKNICDELMHVHDVKVQYNAVLKNVTVEQHTIKSVSIIANGIPITIGLKVLIDCSGDSIISQAANLPLIKSENYQAAAQVFTMECVTEKSEFKLGMTTNCWAIFTIVFILCRAL
jgi:hypothetical protein